MNDIPQPSRLERMLSYIGTDPQNQALLADALQLAIEARDVEKGLVLLAHIEKYGTQDPVVEAHAALLALQAGNYKQAVVFGEAALAGGIDAQAIRFNTAYAQLYCGNHARVDELLTEAEGYDSCSPEYLVLKASALHHLARPEEAETLLRLAIVKAPQHTDALGLLALLLQEDNRSNEAQVLADKALAIAPTHLEALLARADSHFDNNDLQAARNAFEIAVQQHPESGRAWSGLGHIAFSELDFQSAEKLLQEAINHMPDHIGTWHVLAWIYILQGHPEKARKALLASYELDRNFGDTHGGLAVVDVMQGKEAEARTGIRKALRLAPDGMAARYAELLLLERAGDTDSARQLVETVLNQPAGDRDMLRKTLVEQKLRSLQSLSPRNSKNTL